MNFESLMIIVTYNSEDFIEKALKSIIGQDYKKFFLLIIDNNSKDNTLEKIKNFQDSLQDEQSNIIKVVKLDNNIGFAGAVNYGVFRVKTGIFKYLVLLNPDIYLENSSIGKLVSTFDISKDIGVAGGLILDYKKDIIQHSGGFINRNLTTGHADKDVKLEQFRHDGIKEVDYPTGAFFATGYELFKRSGGFDRGYRPVYYEELDYCSRLKRFGKRIVVNPESIARHYEGASIGKFSRDFYRYYHKNRIRFLVINRSVGYFLKTFIKAEVKWLRDTATKDQYRSILAAYFINILFLLYNLIIKLKNRLIIKRI